MTTHCQACYPHFVGDAGVDPKKIGATPARPNEHIMLKVKDWPPEDDFKRVMVRHNKRIRGKLVWVWWVSGSMQPKGTRVTLGVFDFDGTPSRGEFLRTVDRVGMELSCMCPRSLVRNYDACFIENSLGLKLTCGTTVLKCSSQHP
eukprot:1157119-Pelagomonas_calceolata.AAC.13